MNDKYLDELNRNIKKNKLIENELICKIGKYEKLLIYFNNCEHKKSKLRKERRKTIINLYINFVILSISLPIYITLPIIGFIPIFISILGIINNGFLFLDKSRKISDNFNKKNIKEINSELRKYKKRLNTIIELNNNMIIERKKLSKSKIQQYQSNNNAMEIENSNIKKENNCLKKTRTKKPMFRQL